MHFKMLSAICCNLDQSKILSSGNGTILSVSNFLCIQNEPRSLCRSCFSMIQPVLYDTSLSPLVWGDANKVAMENAIINIFWPVLTHSHTMTSIDASGKGAF